MMKLNEAFLFAHFDGIDDAGVLGVEHFVLVNANADAGFNDHGANQKGDDTDDDGRQREPLHDLLEIAAATFIARRLSKEDGKGGKVLCLSAEEILGCIVIGRLETFVLTLPLGRVLRLVQITETEILFLLDDFKRQKENKKRERREKEGRKRHLLGCRWRDRWKQRCRLL